MRTLKWDVFSLTHTHVSPFACCSVHMQFISRVNVHQHRVFCPLYSTLTSLYVVLFRDESHRIITIVGQISKSRKKKQDSCIMLCNVLRHILGPSHMLFIVVVVFSHWERSWEHFCPMYFKLDDFVHNMKCRNSVMMYVCITSVLLWTLQKPIFNTQRGTTCCVFIKTFKHVHPVCCVIWLLKGTLHLKR